MQFDPEKEEKNDFFDGPDIPEPEVEPKRPTPPPDDPDYWDNEESEWEHLKPRRRTALWLWLAGLLVVAGLCLGLWLRFFSPYVTEAVQFGYVEHIEARGTIFKTYEGVLLPFSSIMDTTRVYNRDFIFTAADDKTAAALKRAMLDCRPVAVEYDCYHATLPWRGASKIVITGIDSIDPGRFTLPSQLPSDTE